VALNLAAVASDWTLAASIMTFAIPVGLFVVVATWLYFLYTRPHAVPGHRELVPAGGTGRHAAGASLKLQTAGVGLRPCFGTSNVRLPVS